MLTLEERQREMRERLRDQPATTYERVVHDEVHLLRELERRKLMTPAARLRLRQESRVDAKLARRVAAARTAGPGVYLFGSSHHMVYKVGYSYRVENRVLSQVKNLPFEIDVYRDWFIDTAVPYADAAVGVMDLEQRVHAALDEYRYERSE